MPKENNFDVTSLFLGVPVFFSISGFLISKSYENNRVVREFALNRILRIYPALVAASKGLSRRDCIMTNKRIGRMSSHGVSGRLPHKQQPLDTADIS